MIASQPACIRCDIGSLYPIETPMRPGWRAGCGKQRAFKRWIAGAEHGELAAQGDDLRRSVGSDHVHALLPGQAADDAEDRRAVIIAGGRIRRSICGSLRDSSVS